MSETANLPEQLHQRPGTEVARRYGGSDDAALDAGDILIPRMKIGQKISRVVDDQPELYAAILILTSRDDNEPEVLAPAPAKGEKVGNAVRFYIHGDPLKAWSWTQPDKTLGRSQFYPDLALVENQDPRKVRRTYDYLVTVPDYPMLPVRFLMHGAWGGQAAKAINTQILLARQQGIEIHTIPFKLQARKTSSPQGGQERPYTQALVAVEKIDGKSKAQYEKDQELVKAHITLVGGSNVRTLDDEDTEQPQATQVAADAPSID